MNTDKVWEHLGQSDPYWAVATLDRFRQKNWDQQSQSEFFASGEININFIFDTIQAHFIPQLFPQRALDFGCGVGRLVLPLARRCAHVTGVDVADSMLQKARQHVEDANLQNVALVKADDELSRLSGKFDLITSMMVIQHIHSSRGQKIIQRLIDLLDWDGVAALQLCYSHENLEHDWDGMAPSYHYRFWYSMRKVWRSIRRNVGQFGRFITGARRMKMEMFPYTLNPIFQKLQKAGIRRFFVEFTDHGGSLGVALFFQKHRNQSYFL